MRPTDSSITRRGMLGGAAGLAAEGPGAHHGAAQLGQLALGQVRVVVVERFGGDEAEDGVAEEFEALVILISITPVGECQQKPLWRFELIADAPL